MKSYGIRISRPPRLPLAVMAIFHWGSLNATQYSVLPTVTVSGSYVDYGGGTWYSPDFLSGAASAGPGASIGAGHAMAAAKERAWDLSNVCLSPVSDTTKKTTHESDEHDRWMAAQEVFNVITGKNLFTIYGAAVNGLRFLMDGKIYRGFKVTYADGWVETWAILPNHMMSSIKLLNRPLPGSLKPSRSPSCIS